MSSGFNEITVLNGSLTFQHGAVEIDKEAIEQSSLTTGITKPHPHDVLSGRGNSINSHPGNQYFRSLVKHLKNEYVVTPKAEKPLFAKLILKHIRALKPPGRFLKKNEGDCWFDIGEKKALDKTRQALREDAEKILVMIQQGQRAVTTNVRTSMTLKSPPTTLVNSKAPEGLMTSFTQLKQGSSIIQPVSAFSHLNGGPAESRNRMNLNPGFGRNGMNGSMNASMNASMNGSIRGNMHGSMSGSMNGSMNGSFNNSFNNSLGSVIDPIPLPYGVSSQPLGIVQETNISSNSCVADVNAGIPYGAMHTMNRSSLEPLPSTRVDDFTMPVPHPPPLPQPANMVPQAFPQTVDMTGKHDKDVEEFPGGSSDEDAKEEFPGDIGVGSNFSIRSSEYSSNKESFLGGSNSDYSKRSQDSRKEAFLGSINSDYSKQSQEEFPGGSSGSNYPMRSSLNGGRVAFFDDTPLPKDPTQQEKSEMEAGTPSFYALDGDRINLRPSFVHVEQSMPLAPSRTRNSLYHPDLETCKIDRRRSSVIATKLLEQLQKLDEEIEDSESEEEEENRDFRPKRKLSASEAISHFRGSLRQSLTLGNLDEIFDPRPETKRADRRKSTRMSLLLRQSLISSWANITEAIQDDGEEVGSRSIADLFNAKKDRRRSVITESSNDLLKKVFGNEKGDIPPGCEKDILKEILDPHSTDILMTSVLSTPFMDDSLALLRAEYEHEEEDENQPECSKDDTPLNVHMETGIMNLKMT
eukprot:CAMPEP_0203665980 /NCGR_PEP_ID=MMETSP0090-20130426/3113_1 /ASSEMBLY_ACC=CAM_ASM_001088 /TAXON_ID=426623 /ORGANISM="Chaetoceros affinis, Strain CCMP159" /LENGTH=749 /DNA_ID=CAMNT_0050529739 /DNA_START=217 /DNA_END=2466 /DNA_ORIENTATION=+